MVDGTGSEPRMGFCDPGELAKKALRRRLARRAEQRARKEAEVRGREDPGRARSLLRIYLRELEAEEER
jgi:hypothetical protein